MFWEVCWTRDFGPQFSYFQFKHLAEQFITELDPRYHPYIVEHRFRDAPAFVLEDVNDMQVVTIDYTNHDKKRSIRKIMPLCLYWGHTEWHPMQQWLLKAWCFEKAAERDFAIADIREWIAYKPFRELTPEEYAVKVAAGKKIKLAEGGNH